MLTVAGFIVPAVLLYWRTIRLHGQDVIGDEEMVGAHRLHRADERGDGADVGAALRLRKDDAELHRHARATRHR